MILATMISCEGGGGSSETTTPTPTPDNTTPTTPTFSCDDKDNIYQKWSMSGYAGNVGTWTILIDLSAYTEGLETTHFVDLEREDAAGVGGADYKFLFDGDGCNGTFQMKLPLNTIGTPIDYNAFIFNDMTETYEIYDDGKKLKVCDGALCYTYDKID